MTVNGLKLPDAFVALLERPDPPAYWAAKGGNEAWEYRGGVGGLYWVPKVPDPDGPDFLSDLEPYRSLAEVQDKTNRLPVTFHISEYSPQDIAGFNARYAQRPGWIPFVTDFSQIVCFGETSMAEALCFDYRESPGEPSIIHWNDGYWRRVAPNFDAFMSLFTEPPSGRLELGQEDY